MRRKRSPSYSYQVKPRPTNHAAPERNLFATPLFWAGIAFLALFAVAGSLVVVGAGPSSVGAIIGIVVALVMLAIGVIVTLAMTSPRILRGSSSDEDWGFW